MITPRRLAGAFVLSLSVAAPGLAQPAGPTDDLEVGVAFVSEGDFEAAAETLEAVTFILDGQPERRSDAARASVYLGWALLYTDSEAAAMQRFYDAQRHDPRFVPPPTQFPRRVIRLWNEAGGAAARPASPPPAEAPDPDPRADLAEFRGAPVDTAGWLSTQGDRLRLQLALAGADRPCPGEMLVDGARERVVWTPEGGAGSCPAAITAPFEQVESVGAAGEGGVAVHLSAGRTRRVFIPRPFAAWFDRGAAGRSHVDLPPEAAVANRLAVREMLRTLGRPASSAWSVYGTPVDVPAAVLLTDPSTYDGRAVRTRGRFARGGSRDAPTYSLVAPGAVIGLAPGPETLALIADTAAALEGTELTVTGVFRRQRTAELSGGAPSYSVSFWSAQSDVLAATSGSARPLGAGLGAGSRDVDVIGQFRASNLFGDVPPRSRRSGGRDHWVLRDGGVSAWVTGPRPQGDGWELDMRSKRDSSTWMRIRGRVSEDDGVYYLDASEMAPAQPLWSQRGASPGMLGWGSLPPDVQFALPMQFEGARPDSLFEVQFTKPVDAATLEGNVELRYRGASGRSDFAWASIEYAEERRSLHIDPGAALRTGQTFEIVLRPGIEDQAGAPLEGDRTLAWRVTGG